MTIAPATVTGKLLAGDTLPEYWQALHAYHCSRRDELRTIIAALPLEAGHQALDVASGDGCYSIWLAERGAHVIGVDASGAYITLASQRAAESPYAERISFKAGDAAALPCADNSFDLAWCAQSFYSLPDPAATLGEMIRVTRPGGAVAVLENDTLHQIVLPWPAWLELAVRQAQLETQAERHTPEELEKFYIGRNLTGMFQQHGLEDCEVQTFSVERDAPLCPDEQVFLQSYFADVRERAWPHLAEHARAEFERLFQPSSPDYLFGQPDLHLTHLELLAIGRKPA